MFTSEQPEPHIVLETASTSTPPSVLSQEASQKELAMFYIGLEMLGDKKKERFLSYLLSLQTPTGGEKETQP